METLDEQPQRSVSRATAAIHILQAIFQKTRFRNFPGGEKKTLRQSPMRSGGKIRWIEEYGSRIFIHVKIRMSPKRSEQ
jgi:hypothetical protein